MELKEVKMVEKPWGREVWIAHENEYAGKILEVKKGFCTSLQYHKEKKESMYVLEGRMRIVQKGGKELILNEGQSITINPNDVHRVIAETDVKILEVSTPQLDDVVRIEDDYGRKPLGP